MSIPHILVIDDSDLISKLLREALTEAGYEVALAPNADIGYQKAVEHTPDLILLDVQLPDVMGFELLRVLRNHQELVHVPVIMVTGTHHQVDHRVRGLRDGADDYVLKPFEMPELIERIRIQLRKAEAQRISRPASLSMTGKTSRGTVPEAVRARTISHKEMAIGLLLDPLFFDRSAELPSVARLYLFVLSAITLSAMSVAAGPMPKMVLIATGIPLAWGALVSALVIGSSVIGIPLNWREGARLLSAAGLPVLIKAACAFFFSLLTTLPPFYFSGGPALFARKAWPGLGFFDLFLVWSGFLLGWLLQGRPRATVHKAWGLAAMMWFLAGAFALSVGKLTP